MRYATNGRAGWSAARVDPCTALRGASIWLVATLLLLPACGDPTGAPRSAGEPGAPEAASVSAAQHTQADVLTHPSLGPATPVPNAKAKLTRTNNGVSFVLQTAGLVPGNAYTVWWVKIDAPENCAAIPCSGADVLGNVEGVLSNVAYGAGRLAGGTSTATLAGAFSTGPVPGGWYDNEFQNPRDAEIHLVVMDHGPAVPGLVSSQISSLRGGCTDESVNTPPISGFPDVAKADGTPGPNTCRLVQLVIFTQD